MRTGIQLCYPFEEKRLRLWQPPYIVQPKLDGYRCRALQLPNGNYCLLSSEENFIHSCPHILEELNRVFPPDERQELDGELYIHNSSFECIESIVGRTVNLHPDHKKVIFNLFDLPHAMPQIKRIIELAKLEDRLQRYVKVVPYYLAQTLSDVMEIYDSLVGQNYEGIIVRELNAPYIRRRSTFVMKFKPKSTDEYKIIGFKQEVSVTGEPKDSLGAFVCLKDGQEFSVGSGLKGSERREMWKFRHELIGKTVVIGYQHTTKRGLPRFPIFMEVKSER